MKIAPSNLHPEMTRTAPTELGALPGAVPLRSDESPLGDPDWRRELCVSEQASGYKLEAFLPGMESHLVEVSMQHQILTQYLAPTRPKNARADRWRSLMQSNVR